MKLLYTTKITFRLRFGFMPEAFIRTDISVADRQYVKACPTRGSIGSSHRLVSRWLIENPTKLAGS